MQVVYVSPDKKSCLLVIEDVFDREQQGDSDGHYFQVLDLESNNDIIASRRLSLEEQHACINAQGDLVDSPYIPAPKSLLKFQHGDPAQYGQNGLTNEHVIAASIYRLEKLQQQQYSDHNETALRGLRMALVALDARYRELHGKG